MGISKQNGNLAVTYDHRLREWDISVVSSHLSIKFLLILKTKRRFPLNSFRVFVYSIEETNIIPQVVTNLDAPTLTQTPQSQIANSQVPKSNFSGPTNTRVTRRSPPKLNKRDHAPQIHYTKNPLSLSRPQLLPHPFKYKSISPIARFPYG